MTPREPTLDQVECPSTKQLLQWLDGQSELPPATLKHLESCPRCIASLNSLSNDEKLQGLIGHMFASPLQEFSGEPEFMRLRSALSELSGDLESGQLPSSHADARTTVRTDLTSVDHSGQLLAAPSVESLNQRLPEGRFSVDRLIGQGGSGAVYLAFDHRLQREVAIKVLGSESLRDRQRFLREARILADLEHANVVRIFDFGTLSAIEKPVATNLLADSERLYLVMEYVPGGPVKSLCAVQSGVGRALEGKASSASVAEGIGFRQLAELIATAADGLAAAHVQALVHRDVKPGNLLLVADLSSIKVADFGLARFGDADVTQVTRTGEILGTPVFMSPEQVTTHDVTASSDIYSLGATLYQLLTGNPPFQGNVAAILRQIADTQPIPPRVLNPSVPHDLELICMHAMEKTAPDRYASMTDFAADLRRFVANEPIYARPVSSAKKAYRFLKRNPSFAAVLSLAVVSLLALSIGGVGAAAIFANQNMRLKQSSDAERSARVAAQNSLSDALEAADQLLLSVTEDTELLPRAPGSEEVARKLLTKAQEYYQRLMSGATANEKASFDAARARSGLAIVALRLGDAEGVEAEAEAALELLDSLPANAIPSAERAAVRAKTLFALGKSLATRGIFERAIEVMNEAVKVCEEELQRKPENEQLQFLLADSLRGRAVPQNMAGNLTEAEQSLLQAQALFSALLTKSPEDATYLRRAAGCESTLAVTLGRRDGYNAAREHLIKANEMLKRLTRDGQLPIRLRPDFASNIVNLASVEFYLGNHQRAQELFVEAEREYLQLSQLEPGVVEHRYNEVLTTLNSGKVAVALEQIDELLPKYRELVPKMEALLISAPDSIEYLGTLGLIQGNLAIFLRMLERPEEALPALQESTRTLERYAELVGRTPDSLYGIALNQYQLAKCNHDLMRIESGLQSVEQSRLTTAATLAAYPDYLPARMHQVDEWMLKCDLLLSAKPVDTVALLNSAELALACSSALLKAVDDAPEYQIAHGNILSTLGEALVLSEQPDAAEKIAEQGVTHLLSLEDVGDEDSLRDALKYNYLVLANVVAIRLQKHLSQSDVANDQLRKQLETQLQELTAKCRECGASDEELDFS